MKLLNLIESIQANKSTVADKELTAYKTARVRSVEAEGVTAMWLTVNTEDEDDVPVLVKVADIEISKRDEYGNSQTDRSDAEVVEWLTCNDDDEEEYTVVKGDKGLQVTGKSIEDLVDAWIEKSNLIESIQANKSTVTNKELTAYKKSRVLSVEAEGVTAMWLTVNTKDEDDVPVLVKVADIDISNRDEYGNSQIDRSDAEVVEWLTWDDDEEEYTVVKGDKGLRVTGKSIEDLVDAWIENNDV